MGETVDVARKLIDTPILKIDEPMAEAAVAAGKRIAVHATVASTLGPTVRLLQAKAKEAGKEIEISERLCDGAFDLLVCGQTDQHDEAVSKDVLESAKDHDVVLFAQASMARLVPKLKDQISVPLLSSPALADWRGSKRCSPAPEPGACGGSSGSRKGVMPDGSGRRHAFQRIPTSHGKRRTSTHPNDPVSN